MAYVSVPKDMAEVKTRLIMNLTKRQVICFGAAAAIGTPLFLTFRDVIGNTGAMTLMIAAVIPAFFFAIYNKDGVIPAERYLLLILRQKFFFPKIRVYQTQNMYAFIENNAGSTSNPSGSSNSRNSSNANNQNKAKEGYFGNSTEKPKGAGKASAAGKTAKSGTTGKPVSKTSRT